MFNNLTKYMTKTLLKDAILQKLRGDEKAVRFLSYKLNVSHNTIKYWLKNNHPNLTRPDEMRLIREYLSLSKNEVIIQETEMSDTTTDL